MPRFTDEQARELRQHLAVVVTSEAELHAVLLLIERAFVNARTALAVGAAEVRRREAVYAGYWTSVRTHAAALRDALSPTWPELELPQELWKDDWWEQFNSTLGAIIDAAATQEASALPGPTRRGRPPFAWRDALIGAVRDLYPHGAATATRDGHFETTIRLLLRHLDQEVEDLHSVLLDARRRQPGAVTP